MVAYIVINGKYVALLNQDQGPDLITVEFLEDYPEEGVDIEVLTEALIEAKRILLNG
ncbi:hypothetical protein [Hymenobacter glacieicola]|uniref:hypothetical protein n=1 Tax=Hymenobacter glacieicola TaxID=1562124 RepID=UPI001E5C9B0B|nr:hypothetical protein [Hymenobacter glacieicola]